MSAPMVPLPMGSASSKWRAGALYTRASGGCPVAAACTAAVAAMMAVCRLLRVMAVGFGWLRGVGELGAAVAVLVMGIILQVILVGLVVSHTKRVKPPWQSSGVA